MTYRCLPGGPYESGERALVPLRREDILSIKAWRNAQIDLLRQRRPLTDEDQERYYEAVVRPTFDAEAPPMILLSYLVSGRCIGYGGLVHIDWDCSRAEVSFLLDPDRARDPAVYEQDFTAYLGLLARVAFEALGFHRLFTETFDVRPHHVAILERFGFRLEGRLRDHVRIGGRFVDSLMHGLLNERTGGPG